MSQLKASIKWRVPAQAARAGMVIGSVIAAVAAVGAPMKWF